VTPSAWVDTYTRRASASWPPPPTVQLLALPVACCSDASAVGLRDTMRRADLAADPMPPIALAAILSSRRCCGFLSLMGGCACAARQAPRRLATLSGW